MKKIMEKLKSLMPSKRKLMQLYLALLFNANLKGFVSGRIYSQDGKVWCAPGINCYSCPGAVGACPLGSFQGSFSGEHSTIYYVVGILLLYAVLFGRMICGWACPFGLIEELLYKIKSPKLKKNPVTRILSFFKYVVLVFFVLIVPIMYGLRDFPLPSFCKYICPIGTIEGGLGLLSNSANEGLLSLLGPLFTWKFMLMVSIVVGSIFIFRLFCRFICPLGAFYGLFNKFSMFGVKVDESKCTHCNLCIAHCKVDIKHVGDQECINCGECIDVCPTKAISWKGSKIFVKSNELPENADEATVSAHIQKQKTKRTVTRVIAAVVMLAVLFGAFVYYWNITPPLETQNPTTPPTSSGELVEGNQVGNLCLGGDLPILATDGSGKTGETINPVKTGKVTVINFWGIECGPCIAELPYFDQLATEYENVSVIAIHQFQKQNGASAWLKSNDSVGDRYTSSKITFTLDNGKDTYYYSLGGKGTWPMTVILDERGVITHTIYKSIHSYEELKGYVDEASASKPQVPQGNQVGNLCLGGDLPILATDGSGKTGETINPVKTGKVTVINFWGIECGPCIAELPYFDQLAAEYENVSVIAIHQFQKQNGASAWLKSNDSVGDRYTSSQITFTLDNGKDTYYYSLGGKGTWPMTVILDENGIITHTIYKSIHSYEELQTYVEEALGN